MSIFHPFINFSKRDWALWLISIVVVLASNLLSPEFDILILIAALVGVTSLILAAKGNVWAQILMVLFSILYGIISFRFRYWGEMITYLGMTMPMAVWSAIVWFRNPSEKAGEVKIGTMTRHKWWRVMKESMAVTIFFYLILKHFDTPNLGFSTLSITTSFIAASLTILRSPYFALFYAANDVVLIVLWVMATMVNPVYFPVIINFVIFLINDLYGFISWRRRSNEQ